MVTNNKVLTVSYGTFSCTLEGFDDSFGTMKAIAEYFRDLASDDRYFGAEPPQPDADMLARIAQREISRQVQASTSATGILLRATDAPDAVAEQSPVAQPAVTPSPPPQPAAADVAVADAKAEEAEPEEVAQAEVADTKAAPVEAVEPVAAPVEAASVETAEAQAAPPDAVEVESSDADPAEAEAEVTETDATDDVVETVEAEAAGAETAEAEIAETVTETEVEVAAEVEEVEVETEAAPAEAAPAEDHQVEMIEVSVEETVVAEVIETVEVEEVKEQTDDNAALAAVMAATTDVTDEDTAEAVASDDVAAEPAPKPDAEFIPAADSIAAKLQRIRAVVSQNDQVVSSDDYTEDEHAEPFVAGVAHEITQALNAEDEDQPTSPAVQAADDEISRVLDQLDASHDDVTKDVQTQTQSDANALFDDLDDDDSADDLISDDIDNILGVDDQADLVADDQKPKVRARIVKVKRSELQAAIEAGDLEEIEDDEAPESDQPQQDSSLTEEDEAELLRELASVEAELAPETESVETADVTEAIDAPSVAEPEETALAVQVSAAAPAVKEDEADLSRLMDAADEKLDDPETSSSRETYGHMRAAVAAAQAERAAGGTVGQHTEDEAYREDLASVVRPRRPTTGGTRPRRPAADARPAPLKLVAEQRVDEGAGQVRRGAVRPRRVMTVPLEDADHVGSAEGEGGFADFATRVGATELPDMLEAAAAYLSFVEGREQFSRPQLMNKVRQIKEDEFNREDGLRSFGQLLRDGKIQKTGGGRFTVSGQIGFRPDTREAG